MVIFFLSLCVGNVRDVIVQILSGRQSFHTDDRYRSLKHECELQSRPKQKDMVCELYFEVIELH